MDFDEQKRGLVFALTNTLRTSRLVDMINAQEATAAFAMVLNQQPAGKPIDIEPFYRWLVDQKKLPKDVVAETLIFLKSRESRYQVELILPQEVRSIDEATRAKIVQEFVQRGASTSGIYQGLKEPPKEPEKGKGDAGIATPRKSAPRAASSSTRLLLIALVVVAAAGGGVTYWINSGDPKEPAKLQVTDAGALPCVTLQGNNGYAQCHIRMDVYKAMSAADFDKAGNITKDALMRQGYSSGLIVFGVETNRPLKRF